MVAQLYILYVQCRNASEQPIDAGSCAAQKAQRKDLREQNTMLQ